MRTLLCLWMALVFFTITLKAETYYISAAGDNTDGLTPATAWQTIDKLNTSFGVILPGDSILFNCGEIFYGSIIMGSSGTASAPIVISSYGSGAKPVISGFTSLAGWTSVDGNIWECDAPALKNNVNILTIDGTPYAVGRTPNDSFYAYQSATTTQLTSNMISGATSWIGSEIVMRKTSWRSEKAKITSVSGGTITYIRTLPIDNNLSLTPIAGTPNYGFFLQRSPLSLDQFGEWYFDTSAKKMQLYSPTDPSSYTIKASSVDTLILLGNRSNIIISNLAIEGGGMYGVESYNATNVSVINCSFNNNTKAVYIWNTNDANVDNNSINNSFNGAILISNNQRKRINIKNNTITNTSLLLGMGLFWSDSDLKTIVAKTDTTTASNYINIINNTIINCGLTGIQFQGSNVTIRRNIIDSFLRTIDDGGGIYTYTSNQSLNTLNFRNRLIDSNFISNAIGAPKGANGSIDVCGFYLDDQTANVTGLHNTIFNVPGNGMQMNTPHDNIFIDNTVYNTAVTMSLNKRFVAEVYNNVVKSNVLYQKDSSQLNLLYTNGNLSLPTAKTITQSLTGIANIDSNWITNSKQAGYRYYYSLTGSGSVFPPNFTLETWRGTYLHDVNSALPPLPLTDSNTSIEYNQGYTRKKVLFTGYSKIDPKGNVYDNSVTIPKWSSIVLIDNGIASSANLSPEAYAGNSIAITLPTNTTTLTGSASDSDGTVSSYVWEKISGPAAGTIVTPNDAATVLNNLVQGVYLYQLTVTDNNGATGKDVVQVIVNKAPVVNAGTDKLINFPTSSVSLTGSSTDTDGTISSETWLMISGPAPATIVTPNAAITTVNNLVQGIYQFELTATDNYGAASKDIVQVIVNQPPVALAGTDKLVILPANSETITGAGTDIDGTISTYAWVKLSGPASGTIVTPNAATTVLNSLVQGVYLYQLTVTDNKAATGKDTIQVIVNVAPIANAGTDKLISLPINNTTLTGSGTDADGTISAYAWVKISGPDSGTIVIPDAATTDLNDLVKGLYQFELTVTDNNGVTGKDTVVVLVNQAPVANAGPDKIINLPANTLTLSGSGTDADGTISSYTWVKIAGPSSGSITAPNIANTSVNGLVQGIYQFELTVTDNQGGTGKDTMVIIVYPAPNIPPSANAGADILINLPVSSTTLNGSGTDADGIISSYEWLKIAGPAEGTIVTPAAAVTNVNNLAHGTYEFELTVADDSGVIKKDTMLVMVNLAPVVNAGSDILISSPDNSVSLTGTGTDEDGTIVSYAWIKISGPTSGTIATPNNTVTNLNNLVPGVYQYELTVTDNNGAAAKDTIQVTVNQAPVANAGTDKQINLPENSTTLTGTGSDADGTISTYEWIKISGPASGTMVTPTAAATILNNLERGLYQFELTVTDNNGASAKDTVQVIVNQAPVANAGTDILISLPNNTTTLTGSGTDADGTVSGYAWIKISGPASGIIVLPGNAAADLNNLVQGVYQFELTVSDNDGGTGKDTVQVTVNQAPVANAGINQLINLPNTTSTLTGNGTDADGTISAYAWVKISGPASGTIVTPNTAATTLNNLVQGVYQFGLTVTDNNGATGADTIQVTVNQAPVSNAGPDKLINLPTNTTTLTGSGTDADGSISSYTWEKISGPASVTIVTPNTAATTLNNLLQGVYQFKLTVTDNSGATGADTIQVTVNQAPVANAGADKIIILPTNTTALTGSGTDVDGAISNYTWIKISGPASGTIATPNAATTTLNNLVQGIYLYQLTVTDNNGATGRDTIQIILTQAPVVNAGTDKLISLPINSVTLTGTGTDADGTIAGYSWLKISGPVSGTIAAPNSATTILNSLVQGIYLYQLTVTDNNGATGKDTVQVIVNQPPVANAGVDKLINLPTSNATLTGIGTDADGTISTYAWVKLSGPRSGTISSPNAATTNLSSLAQGVYLYQLTVTDNRGAIGRDTIQVFVNRLPVANAGTDKLITLPANSVTLTGSGTDADGTIASYSWVKISGPAAGTIATPNSATTVLNSLAQGVYQYQLTVTDNRGATATDVVQVTVNQPPVANAGADKMITLPTNSVSLTGSGTDADGTISSYAWTKIAGPSSGKIGSQNSATTNLTSLVQGTYRFQLTVTDNRGSTGKDTVQVTVNGSQLLITISGYKKTMQHLVNHEYLELKNIQATNTASGFAWINTRQRFMKIATPVF